MHCVEGSCGKLIPIEISTHYSANLTIGARYYYGPCNQHRCCAR